MNYNIKNMNTNNMDGNMNKFNINNMEMNNNNKNINNMNMNNMNNMNLNNMNMNNINMTNMNNMNMDNINMANMKNMNYMNQNNNNNINMNNMDNMNMNNNMNNMHMNNMDNMNMNNNMNNMNKNNMNNMNMNNMNNMNMNNMGNMNMNNNMNNMNMNNMNNIGINNTNQNFNLPLKAIKNYNINMEASYINSVLQAFFSIDCIKNWIKILNNSNLMNKVEASLTKEFYQMFCSVYSGQRKIDSTNIIFHFENKTKMLYNKDIKKDPYHFLFYFLNLLHFENNSPINPNFDMNTYTNQQFHTLTNDNMMLKLYRDYFQQTQNSIISDCFFNTLKYCMTCPSCLPLYSYSHKKIMLFDVDLYRIIRDQMYPHRRNNNLSLDECFFCYYRGNPQMCNLCGNNNSYNYQKIYCSTKVLIFSFKRNNHIFKGDIDFGLEFSISNYVINNSYCYNRKYILKSCIYYCNMPKYFADVNINNNWIRCMDINNTYDVKILKSLSELYRFEPQILIYELEETQNTFMNPFYEKNVMLKNFNALQLIQMQIQRLLMDQVQNLNQNFMLTNNVMKVQDLSNQMVKFLIIPENWDYSEDNSIKILCHATSNDTIKKMINNFFTKLQKPRQAITKFTFNNNIIDPNSYLKLKDLCINSKSTIYAIKSFNFDLLKL